MKRINNDLARRVRVRPIVAYPAVSVALCVSAALALTQFAPSALAATPSPAPSTTPISSPTATTAPSPAPSSTPSAGPSSTPSAAPTSTPGLTAIPSPSSGSVTTLGATPVDHHVLAQIDGSGLQASYLPLDAPVPDASQFQTIRVRFKMHNAGTAPITARPQLEYRPDGSSGYIVVPEESLRGIPLRVDREWVPIPGGGTKQGPLGEDIAVADFLTGNEGGGLAMIGHHSMGANPDQQITLPPASYTEQEFSVRLTMDAEYLTGYDLRITNGQTVLAGTQVAKIHLGPPPALQLSPNQKRGLAVGGPKPARGTGVVK